MSRMYRKCIEEKNVVNGINCLWTIGVKIKIVRSRRNECEVRSFLSLYDEIVRWSILTTYLYSFSYFSTKLLQFLLITSLSKREQFPTSILYVPFPFFLHPKLSMLSLSQHSTLNAQCVKKDSRVEALSTRRTTVRVWYSAAITFPGYLVTYGW